jgi:hypothetical protein
MGVIMIKIILIVPIIILFSCWNISLGQENNKFQSVSTSNYSEKNSVTLAERPERPVALIHLKELSSEELELITGEGSENFLTFNDNQINHLTWIILWDEIPNQKNASTNGSIELTSSGGFMNGIRENGIFK